jgi:alpha-beta hydrolase superfamily lysophospholipase
MGKTSTGRKPRLSRILLWTAVAIVLVAVILYFGIGFIAAGKFTTPTREFSADLTPAKYQMAYEDIKETARIDGMQIAGWFIPSQGNDKAVIMVPGRNQSRTSELYGRFVELASNLHASGLNVLMIDLRGHGQSPDANYSFGIIERRDVEGAVDWLIQKGFKEGSIGALGISLGAASVIGAAAEEPKISAIVEDSCYADLNPIMKTQFADSGLPGFLLTPSLWMVRLRFGFDLTEARPVQEMSAISPRPMLIIHSKTDELVPEQQAEQLRAAYPQAEAWILDGPEHARSFNAYPQEYSQRVNAFFDKYLK